MIKVKFIPKYFPIVLLPLDSIVKNKTFRKSLTYSRKSGKRNNKRLFKNTKNSDSKVTHLVKILKSNKKNKFSKKRN